MSTIHSILVPSDLSSEAEHALQHASVLAERFSASLTLYHSVPLPDHAYAHWAFTHNAEIWCEVEREARLALVESAARLGHQAVAKVERTTSISRALLAFIRDSRPDLIVMATHGREGLSHALLGSVTERVFLNCHRPVLCVRRISHHQGGLPYRRVLVPTDLSPASRLVFPAAAELARAFDAEVMVVHVTHTNAAMLAGMSSDGGVFVPSEASMLRACERDFEGLRLTARVDSGGVADRIAHVAAIERADIIVMGTRGHDSLMDRMIGCNTERVVRHAPCPVLVA